MAAATAIVALLVPVFGAVFMATPTAAGALLPTQAALEDIPGDLLVLYQRAAAERCPGLPWTVVAAIGRVETNHGRNVAVSSAGALGPMQFMPPSWRAFGIDADGDGVADVMNPVDAVHSAAVYLCRHGGGNPATLRDAIFAYNRAGWYVDLVLGHAARYGVASTAPLSADASALLASPNLVLTSGARADLAAGIVDARLVALLAALSERHVLAISVFRTGHAKHVAGTTRVSNHWCGQAADIWMIDGQRVQRAHGSARFIAEWLRTLDGPLRPSEVGSPWPDLRGGGHFSDAAHQGHLHIGFGPRCTG
jgi:hypothetical protein